MPIFRSPRLGLSYSQAIAEAYASAPEDVVILDTLEFRHPLFIDPATQRVVALRVVNDHVKLSATLESSAPMEAGLTVDFTPVRFSITRPSETDGGSTPEIQILVSNVSGNIVPYLNMAKESRSPIQVTYRPYLSTDTTAPHMNPPLTLSLRGVSATVNQITATAGFGDMSNRKFPKMVYTAEKFPGLVVR